MVFVNVFLSMRRYFQPTLRTSPFVGAEVGFTRISGAEYKEIVNGVRVTYYEIPGALRLTASAVLGLDHYLSRTVRDPGGCACHVPPQRSQPGTDPGRQGWGEIHVVTQRATSGPDTMTSPDVLSIFKETGALLEGHFQLTSGLHSNQYFQCAKVLQYPRHCETAVYGAGR